MVRPSGETSDQLLVLWNSECPFVPFRILDVRLPTPPIFDSQNLLMMPAKHYPPQLLTSNLYHETSLLTPYRPLIQADFFAAQILQRH